MLRSFAELLFAAALLTIHPMASAATDGDRPDAHAPIGVMGDHVHHAGEWMLSYRLVFMHMEGNRSNGHRVSDGAVLADFPVAPTGMDMEMHMLGLMWAPSDRVTLMGMLPFTRLEMDHRTRMGARFTTRANGIGDVRLSGLVLLHADEGQRLHANVGLSVPTGSVSESDGTPAGHVRLPYPMQLGSGTFDLLPGLTWNVQHGHWSGGAQVLGTLRLGRNRHDYRLGHRAAATAWIARAWLPWISTSLRVGAEGWSNVRGSDDALVPTLVPTADASRRAGYRLDVAAGVNLLSRHGPLRGHRLALELIRPVHEWLDGPQLETDWTLVVGWQRAF